MNEKLHFSLRNIQMEQKIVMHNVNFKEIFSKKEIETGMNFRKNSP